MQAMFQRKQYSLHRLVWAWHHDSDPPQVNHINEDKLDNRIENLEASNPTHNKLHSVKRDLPHYIYPNHGKFVARYRGWNSKTVSTVEEAITLLEQHKCQL